MKTMEQLLTRLKGIQEAELNHLNWLQKKHASYQPLEVRDSINRLEGRLALIENILKFVNGGDNGAS